MRFGWSNINATTGPATPGSGLSEKEVSLLVERKLRERLGKVEKYDNNDIVTIYDKLGPAAFSNTGTVTPVSESINQLSDAVKQTALELDANITSVSSKTDNVAADLATRYSNEKIDELIAENSVTDQNYINNISENLSSQIEDTKKLALEADDVITVQNLNEIKDPRPGVLYIENKDNTEQSVDTSFHWNPVTKEFEAIAGRLHAIDAQGKEIVTTAASNKDVTDIFK